MFYYGARRAIFPDTAIVQLVRCCLHVAEQEQAGDWQRGESLTARNLVFGVGGDPSKFDPPLQRSFFVRFRRDASLLHFMKKSSPERARIVVETSRTSLFDVLKYSANMRQNCLDFKNIFLEDGFHQRTSWSTGRWQFCMFGANDPYPWPQKL